MDIEKIKNYNQKMLAVLSTALALMATIGLIFLLIFLVSEFWPKPDRRTNVLLANAQVEQLKKDSLRQQIISYGSPSLIDTNNLIYIFPVHVKTLEDPEEVDNIEIRRGRVKLMSSSGNYYERNYYGAFNNLVLYDYNTGISTKICETRLVGSNRKVVYFEDDIMVIFTGAEKDSNKDGVITSSDFEMLYLYSFSDKKLRKVTLPNTTVLSHTLVGNQKDLLVKFGSDRNKDDKYQSKLEPSFLMLYNFEKGTLTKVVDEKLEKEIQSLIEN